MKKNYKKKIIFSEPLIPNKQAINLYSRAIKDNFPNEGYYTRLFEKEISKLLKVKYVISCTSGTIAIFLGLKALEVKKEDEILVPNITFPATLNAISLSGAKPILVDVDKSNLLMDVEDIKRKINKKTIAILPVHISGRGSNVESIIEIAKKKKLVVIEDAAEAFMSSIKNKFLGTYGKIGCFSFAPNKIITTGQGGAVVTNDKSIYKIISRLKDQGRVGPTTGGEDNYVSKGYNFKFTNVQATLGLCQLDSIGQRVKILKNNYLFYKKNIEQNDNFKLFNFDLKKGEVPLWVDAFCTKRNKLSEFLAAKNIFCRYFWQPINTCNPYKKPFSGLKNSKDLQKKLIWLPSSLKMNKRDMLKVCNLINQFIKKNF